MDKAISVFELKRRLYENAPLLFKRAVGLIPFFLIAGRSYRDTWKRASDLEFGTAAHVREFQVKRLGKLLTYACQFVPAYRPYRSFVERYQPQEALQEFPLLDKQILKSNFEQYVSTKAKAVGYWESTTGGTTGDQLTFLLDNGAQNREMAFMHRLWSRVGYTPRHRKATFRGVEFPSLSEDCFWQLNPIYNECQFSPFHLCEKNIPRYLEQLGRYRPRYVHGYPSAVAILARYCRQNGVSPKRFELRGILLGSEPLDSGQREEFEAAFGAPVYSWYGHSERIVLAGECELSTAYHHVPDYGFLEIVKNDGEACQEGESGEIVGTGFWNLAMPLIRYRTGDYARRLSRVCKCGRNHERFDQVEGRWQQEYIVGARGSRISVAALNTHGRAFENVLRYQYYQDTPGQLTLRIVPAAGFRANDKTELHNAFQRKTGDELDISLEIVSDIPLTARGKLVRIVQQLPAATCAPVDSV